VASVADLPRRDNLRSLTLPDFGTVQTRKPLPDLPLRVLASGTGYLSLGERMPDAPALLPRGPFRKKGRGGASMKVVLLMLRLRLTSRTLKEKRGIVKSVLARARNRFNVACGEAGLNDLPGDSELAFVTVARSATDGRRLLQELERWLLQERPDLEVTEVQVEEL
jgi:hypothetical protein